MDQTVHSTRHDDCEAAVGDLRGLLALLDRLEDVAPVDDGLHRLVASITKLPRPAANRV